MHDRIISERRDFEDNSVAGRSTQGRDAVQVTVRPLYDGTDGIVSIASLAKCMDDTDGAVRCVAKHKPGTVGADVVEGSADAIKIAV